MTYTVDRNTEEKKILCEMKLSPQCRTSFHTKLEINPNDRPLTLQIQPIC